MPILITKASEFSVSAILEHEYLVVDKEAVEYLEDAYKTNK